MHKILFCIFSLLFQFVHPIKTQEDHKLLFVQILFRHGDRAPINLYPNDPNSESFWTEGLGKLTMLGRKQHYALGKFLREMYGNFTTSSPNEVNVTSSDVDRCIKSAETNLASFFKPTSEWQFDKNLEWQPISIFYIPKLQDKYLETESYCPKAFAEQNLVLHSPDGQAFLARHKAMFENLTVNSGSPITDWTSASFLHDTLFIEKKYNLTIPAWASPYWKELENVADLSFYWSFNSPLLHRLRAGPLLQNMIQMMEEKIAGKIPLLKFQIYSAHDTNIAVMLDALSLYNMKQPPYCAALLLELHQLANGKNAVRLLYQNSTEPEKEIQTPRTLILEGCTEFCPLDFFINFTQKLIPSDWEKECQLNKSFIEKLKEKNITIGLFLASISLIIVLTSIYSIWRFYSRNRDKYSYHLMPLS